MPNPFATGVSIFFRVLDANGMLARSVHMDGRKIVIQDADQHPDDYVILNDEDVVVGVYPREWVAAILPLQTTGPANDPDQQTRRDNSPAPTEGNPQGISRRAKRINSRE